MERGMFYRLGSFSVRRRWYVIGAWIVLTLVMATFAKGLQNRLGQGGFEVPGSDSLSVQHQITRFAGQDTATALVVVHSDSVTVTNPAFQQVVGGIAARVRGVSDVAGVQWANSPAFVSTDGHTTFLVAELSGDQNHNLKTAAAIRTTADSGVPPAYQVEVGGSPAFYNRFNDISRTDLSKAEKISFPITLLVLLMAFGSVVAAGLPIMLAAGALVVTLGLLYFLAGITNMSVYVTNTASVIGIGVGIDYALFVVTRVREELGRGLGVQDAIARAVGTSGRAVALSGATVIVALFGMFMVNVQAFRSMAIGSMTVVAIAVLGALTLLPAVLGSIGRNIDRLRVPFLRSKALADGTGFWHRWALSIMRRPWLYLVASLLVLLTLAMPLFAIRMGQSGPNILPANEGPRLATERLASAFGAGVVGPMEILIDTPGGASTPSNLAAVDRLGQAIAADPAVSRVVSLTTVVPGGLAAAKTAYANGLAGVPSALRPTASAYADWSHGARQARITVIGKYPPESPAAEEFVGRVRGAYVPGAGLSSRAIVGGETAFNVDLEHNVSGRLPIVVATVLAFSFLLLAMAFRSLLLPLKALVMNLLSVGASYGLMVALFQWGWGQSLLGFTSEGHIAVFVPMFLFSILFGLSMDYEVFLMSRMREHYLRTGSNEEAVARGLESSARVITSAALIMVTVFAAFASSRLVPFKEMGFGLAAAIFIDATIVRTILVPAAMKLMGDWNWWMPAWLDRWLPKIALETERKPAPGSARELEPA